MMGEAKRSGEITIPTDRVRALGVYWIRADVMHSLVLATEEAWLEDVKANKETFETYIAFWLSALYVVVEGFRKLKLNSKQVPAILGPRVDTLRHFRNGCFHYQRNYKKLAPFLRGDLEAFDWAQQLHMQFGAYFSKTPVP